MEKGRYPADEVVARVAAAVNAAGLMAKQLAPIIGLGESSAFQEA
jgi:hypothetical protein